MATAPIFKFWYSVAVPLGPCPMLPSFFLTHVALGHLKLFWREVALKPRVYSVSWYAPWTFFFITFHISNTFSSLKVGANGLSQSSFFKMVLVLPSHWNSVNHLSLRQDSHFLSPFQMIKQMCFLELLLNHKTSSCNKCSGLDSMTYI